VKDHDRAARPPRQIYICTVVAIESRPTFGGGTYNHPHRGRAASRPIVTDRLTTDRVSLEPILMSLTANYVAKSAFSLFSTNVT
jgi:hypothetical protein